MPKISVIIPVYNNALYLSKCIDSILSQSFQDFEVVIVDDGSKDGSEIICDNYQKKDYRVKVFHTENKGVSFARNLGLERSCGEWISFIDSDDWVDTEFLSTLYSQVDDETDVVICNLYFDIGGKEIPKVCTKPLIRKKDFPSYPLATLVPECAKADKLFVSLELLSSACNKLTRKSLLINHSIKFNEQIFLNEDGLFHLTSYIYARDFKIIGTPLYHYRIHVDSSNYQYRQDIRTQNIAVSEAFNKLSHELPDYIVPFFKSLLAYRLYLNTMTLWLMHLQNEYSIIKKRSLLKDEIKSGIYNVHVIPSQLSFVKKVELIALQKQWCFMLLLLSKVRQLCHRLL